MAKHTDDTNKETTRKPKLDNFKKRTSYLRAGGGGAGLAHRGTLEWHLNQNMFDRILPSDGDNILAELKELLTKSRTGEAFLEDIRNKDISIAFDNQIAISQFYAKDKLITLNPNQPKMVIMVHLIRELRRSWQHIRGVLFNPLEYKPDEAVLLNRAQQADITMISIRIAWELKLVGENELWEHLLFSSNADIARCFEMQAKSDFRSLNNGSAARRAYDMWFAEERVRFYDKQIIHQMLLDDYAVEKSEDSKELDGQLLYGFANMPHGKNYMALSGYKAPTDREYSVVEDRSNANFLWFIKFERSFQAREREMMQNTAMSPVNIIDINCWKEKHCYV